MVWFYDFPLSLQFYSSDLWNGSCFGSIPQKFSSTGFESSPLERLLSFSWMEGVRFHLWETTVRPEIPAERDPSKWHIWEKPSGAISADPRGCLASQHQLLVLKIQDPFPIQAWTISFFKDSKAFSWHLIWNNYQHPKIPLKSRKLQNPSVNEIKRFGSLVSKLFLWEIGAKGTKPLQTNYPYLSHLRARKHQHNSMYTAGNQFY